MLLNVCRAFSIIKFFLDHSVHNQEITTDASETRVGFGYKKETLGKKHKTHFAKSPRSFNAILLVSYSGGKSIPVVAKSSLN